MRVRRRKISKISQGRNEAVMTEGQVLGPDLLEIEADSFNHAKGGVAEGHEADAAQERIVEQFGLVEEKLTSRDSGLKRRWSARAASSSPTSLWSRWRAPSPIKPISSACSSL